MTGKLVSMKLTKKEAKESFGPVSAKEDAADLPKYPYGLCIHLNGEALKKLDLDVSDYSIGDKCKIIADGEVVGVEITERQSGYEREELEVQITDLDVEWGDEEKKAGERLNTLAGYSEE